MKINNIKLKWSFMKSHYKLATAVQYWCPRCRRFQLQCIDCKSQSTSCIHKVIINLLLFLLLMFIIKYFNNYTLLFCYKLLASISPSEQKSILDVELNKNEWRTRGQGNTNWEWNKTINKIKHRIKHSSY